MSNNFSYYIYKGHERTLIYEWRGETPKPAIEGIASDHLLVHPFPFDSEKGVAIHKTFLEPIDVNLPLP